MLFSSTDCARARESVSAQLDGELSELGLDRLETHLLDCPACTMWAEEVRSMTGTLREAPLEVPPVARFGLARRNRRRVVSGSVALAAAAAVVATMFAPGQQTSAGQHRSSASRFAGPEVPTVLERPLLLDGRYAAVSVARAPQGSLRPV